MAAFILRHRDGSEINLHSFDTITSVMSGKQRTTYLSEDVLNFVVKSATPIEFQIGDTTRQFGQTYTLNQLPTATKSGDRAYQYEVTMEGPQYELIESIFLLSDATKLDSFTGTLEEFAQLICDNANRVAGSGMWQLASGTPDTEAKNLTYTDKNSLQVLQDICTQFNVGFRIEVDNASHRILTIKENVGETFSHVFQYGQSNGAYKIVRDKADETSVITRLFAYGSSDNLGSGYRHNRLCLPSKNKNQSYIQSAARCELFGVKEGVKSFDEIKPERLGTISGIVASNRLQFVDTSMFDLNETEGGNTRYLIQGVTAKVTFQSGNLAGYEFEIESYSHATHTFTLIEFSDENGMKFPSADNAAFQLSAGDTYLLSDITLPQSYIEDAEQRLLAAATLHYNQYSRPQVKYSVSIDPQWLKANYQNSSDYIFRAGDVIGIKDDDIDVNGQIRIESIERDINNPYDFTLTLSDHTQPTTLVRVLRSIRKTDEVIKHSGIDNAARLRRNWKTTEEVLNSVFDSDGYFTDKIRPQSIETQMLAVGARSQQFTLRNVVFTPNYQSNPQRIQWTAGNLDHFTIDDTAVRTWSINSGTITDLVGTSSYYVYARCARVGAAASIQITTEQRQYDSESSYYWFLVGTLTSAIKESSADVGARTLSLTYGSSTINGRFIKTGRISSNDGNMYIDLDEGIISGRLESTPSGGGSAFNVADKIAEQQTDIATANTAAQSALDSFNNMQIGGRNLMRTFNAATFRTSLNLYGNNNGTNYVVNGNTYEYTNTDTHWDGVYYRLRNHTEVGVYTISVEVRGTGGMRMRIGGGSWQIFSINSEWKRVVCSGEINTLELVTLSFTTTAVGQQLFLRNFMCQKGNVATEYVVSPEDLEAEVNTTIASVDVEYALSSSATTAPTSGWQTTAPTWQSGKYMWQRTKKTYKDSSLAPTYSAATCIQGAKGEPGAAGQNGTNGTDGVGISAVTEQYGTSTSKNTQPTTWSNTCPDLSGNTSLFLWTRSRITYTNGTSSYTNAQLDNALIKANIAMAEDHTNIYMGNDIELDKGTYIKSYAEYTPPTGWPSLSAATYYYDINEGEPYTISYDFKAVSSVGKNIHFVSIGYRNADKSEHTAFFYIPHNSVTADWQHFEYSFTIPSGARYMQVRFRNVNIPNTNVATMARNIKLERASCASAYTTTARDTAEMDYISSVLPSGMTTEYGEGVVLAGVLGVKDSGNTNVVAGLDGTAGNNTPMIWAGGSNYASKNNAVFRVYKNGEVYAEGMTAERGTFNNGTIEQATIQNGSITGAQFRLLGSGKDMVISAETLATLRSLATGDTKTINVPAVSYNSYYVLWSGNAQYTNTVEVNDRIITYTAGANGQLSLPNNVKVKFNGVVSPSFNHQNNGTIYLTCKVNGTQKWQLTQSTTTGSDTNVGFGTSYITFTPTTTQKTFDVSAGQIVTLDVRITYYSRTEALPSGTPMVTCYPTYDRQACEYSTSIPEYVCRYSTNGMMLHNETGSGESAVRKFFGFNNTATNNGNEVMLARCGEYGMSLMEQGLMLCRFSGNNVYRYRMNPLVMVVKVTSGNNGFTINSSDVYYNPQSVTTPSVYTSHGTGDLTISHNLGSNNLTFDVSGFGGQCWGFVYDVVNSNRVRLNIINGSSKVNASFILRIFDYGSY